MKFFKKTVITLAAAAALLSLTGCHCDWWDNMWGNCHDHEHKAEMNDDCHAHSHSHNKCYERCN